MKTFQIILLSFICMSSYALTKKERKEYRSKVQKLSSTGKVLASTEILLKITIQCPSASILTSTTAIIDSLPGTTMTPDLIYSILDYEDYRNIERENSSGWGHWMGGVYSGIKNLIQDFSYDLYEEDEDVYKDLKSSYAATRYIYKEAFGESGFCSDQVDKLDILMENF